MKLFINKLNIARSLERRKFSFDSFWNRRLFIKRLNTVLSTELGLNSVRMACRSVEPNSSNKLWLSRSTAFRILSSRPNVLKTLPSRPTALNILSSRPTEGSGEIYNSTKISPLRFASVEMTVRRLVVGLLISIGLTSCASNETLFARYDALCHQGICVAAKPTEVFYTPEQLSLTWEPAVYFGYDLDFMQESEIARLDSNLKFLTQYQDLKISLQGFTDSNASRKYNLALSERRIESVRDYLMQNGITSDRILASRGGESLPINPDDSIKNQIINRRVEMMLLDATGRPLSVGLEPRGSADDDFVPPTPEKKIK